MSLCHLFNRCLCPCPVLAFSFSTQFLRWPEQRPLMLYSVWMFFAMQFLWHAFSFFVDPYTVLLTRTRRTVPLNSPLNNGQPKQPQQVLTHPIALKSHMKKYDTNYHLVLCEAVDSSPRQFSLRNIILSIKSYLTQQPQLLLASSGVEQSSSNQASSARHVARSAHRCIDVTQYFESDGIFCREKFQTLLCELYNEMIQQPRRIAPEAKKRQ